MESDPDTLLRGEDPDPHQNVTDPQHCFEQCLLCTFSSFLLYICHAGRRHAAVLVLREIAYCMPTYFFQNVQQFFEVSKFSSSARLRLDI
jgi:hypothetical protein